MGDDQATVAGKRVPLLRPLNEEREDREEVETLLGEPVLRVRSGDLREHAQLDEAAQPVAQHTGRDAERALEVGEAPDPDERGHEYDGAPPVAEDLEGRLLVRVGIRVGPVAHGPAMVAGNGDVAERRVGPGQHGRVTRGHRSLAAVLAADPHVGLLATGLVQKGRLGRRRFDPLALPRPNRDEKRPQLPGFRREQVLGPDAPVRPVGSRLEEVGRDEFLQSSGQHRLRDGERRVPVGKAPGVVEERVAQDEQIPLIAQNQQRRSDRAGRRFALVHRSTLFLVHRCTDGAATASLKYYKRSQELMS